MISSDIMFFHSGGESNNDPDNDLGGPISDFTINFSPSLNNLFADVSPEDSLDGKVDYRCFYIKNSHEEDSLSDLAVWIDSQESGGSTIELGFRITNEVQTIEVAETPVENGFMILQVPDWGSPFTIYFDDDPDVWAANFQAALRSQLGLAAVEVSVETLEVSVIFTVEFKGEAATHSIDLIDLVQNDLGTDVSIVRVVAGSPINTTASLMPGETSTPPSITFSPGYLEGSPAELGTLRSGEAFPVWVQRDTPPETASAALDNFSLGLSGTT